MLLLRAKFKDMVQNPHSYRLVPGGGYIHVGPIRVGEPLGPPGMVRRRVHGDHPRDLCDPPQDAQHKSWHTLQPPGNADRPVAFMWLPGPQQYMRIDPHAHRMGFPPAYLSSHGWTYKARGKNEHG